MKHIEYTNTTKTQLLGSQVTQYKLDPTRLRLNYDSDQAKFEPLMSSCEHVGNCTCMEVSSGLGVSLVLILKVIGLGLELLISWA